MSTYTHTFKWDVEVGKKEKIDATHCQMCNNELLSQKHDAYVIELTAVCIRTLGTLRRKVTRTTCYLCYHRYYEDLLN